jgi:hypothetical protein
MEIYLIFHYCGGGESLPLTNEIENAVSWCEKAYVNSHENTRTELTLHQKNLFEMNTKEILKRVYHALMAIALFVILLTSLAPSFMETFNRMYYYLDIGVSGMMLTLIVAIYGWMMINKTGKSTWRKWWVAAIPIIFLIFRLAGIKILATVARDNQEFININILNYVYFGVFMLYIAVITFCSNAKFNYRNVLPDQTRINTHIFKWLFIVAQIALWYCFLCVLPTFIDNWFSWWPTQECVNDSIIEMNAEYSQFGL